MALSFTALLTSTCHIIWCPGPLAAAGGLTASPQGILFSRPALLLPRLMRQEYSLVMTLVLLSLPCCSRHNGHRCTYPLASPSPSPCAWLFCVQTLCKHNAHRCLRAEAWDWVPMHSLQTMLLPVTNILWGKD